MNLAIISTSRADLGIYSSFINHLEKSGVKIFLALTGCHESEMDLESFGIESVSKVIATGRTVSDDGSQLSSIQDMSNTLLKVSEIINDLKLDAVAVLGDRFEMHAAAVAIAALKLPLIHFHGGELTFGAIDDKYRHSITQLSELHFVSTERYRQRVIQMGITDSRVFNIGSLALDHLEDFSYMSSSELLKLTGCDFEKSVCLLTIHPETLGRVGSAALNITSLLEQLENRDDQILISGVNLDPEWKVVFDDLMNFKKRNNKKVFYTQSLGKKGYFSAMKYATSMIGNSSSGIIEAASFDLPVLNIGSRQKGREQSKNVINSSWNKEDLILSFQKLDALKGRQFTNIYKKGDAAAMAWKALESLDLKNLVCQREFNDKGAQNV